MSRDPVDLLSRALTGRADAVPAPRPGLAMAARQQARLRRRRQTVVGATALAVAAALVVSPALRPDGRDEQLPAGPMLEVPAGATTRIDPEQLPSGAAPDAAWVSGAVLHRLGGGSLGLPRGPVRAVETDSGGAILATSGGQSSPLEEVAADGHVVAEIDASWPVRGPGGRLAYLQRDTGLLAQERAGTGTEVTVTRELRDATLVGWLGPETLVVNLPTGRAFTLNVQGLAGPLTSRAQVTATDGRTVYATRSTDRSCLEVRTVQRRSWRSCDNEAGFVAVVALSPSGHRALLRRPTPNGGNAYAVVDDTGRVLLQLVAGGGSSIGQAVFETDDTVLVAMSTGPGAGAIARCSVGGDCETAAAHADMPRGPRGPLPFESLWID